ncbi:MAG TPA: DegT/DnrJ/EryC1/StrS family aminotransferase [Flavobacteriaceae bacterium]|nr:DegT/DnrJ/EryC1/StrS family aminotransferase [Flavobacteriaceae bacterium]
MIQFLDLHKINARFEGQFKQEFQKFLDSGQYILGDAVTAFETRFAAYCGTQYCLGVSNGLDALTLLFKGYMELGKLKSGDEVIVPANTFIASILAVVNAGLKPIFVEPETDTYTISPSLIEQHITAKTKAIMPVHLYGQLAKMDKINAVAKEHTLLVIEDAAQAHGAEDKNGGKAGSLSHAAAFSFYPTKNLGALGDAGAITTNDKGLYEVVKKLRNYGFEKRYVSEYAGYNNRMDEIQAMFLGVKLKALDAANAQRRLLAKRYLTEIKNPKVKLPFYDYTLNHVFHLFVVQVTDRTHFVDYLESHGIQTLIHYPVPPHKQTALKEFVSLPLPITEQLHRTVVSLPLHPEVTDDEIRYVIQKINAY